MALGAAVAVVALAIVVLTAVNETSKPEIFTWDSAVFAILRSCFLLVIGLYLAAFTMLFEQRLPAREAQNEIVRTDA